MKAEKPEQYYIYQAVHACHLVLKPQRKLFARDGQNVIATKQIALRFDQSNGLCAHINNDLVEDSPYSVEDIKRALDKTPNVYHKEIRLIYDSSSGEPVPEVTAKNVAPVEQGPAGIGARARG